MVCSPLKEGSLGIRELNSFNQTLREVTLEVWSDKGPSLGESNSC